MYFCGRLIGWVLEELKLTPNQPFIFFGLGLSLAIRYTSVVKAIDSKFIAKLKPSFSFSWAELVFNLNFAPPTHPSTQGKHQHGKAKLTNLLSRTNIMKRPTPTTPNAAQLWLSLVQLVIKVVELYSHKLVAGWLDSVEVRPTQPSQAEGRLGFWLDWSWQTITFYSKHEKTEIRLDIWPENKQ